MLTVIELDWNQLYIKELVDRSHLHHDKVLDWHQHSMGHLDWYRDHIKKLEKDGEISQDEQKVLADKVQKLTDEKIAEIDRLTAAKEKEIMQV